MPRSKVIYGDEVLIDLTADTVTADTLAEGVTAHDAAGNAITGTMAAAKPEQTKTATPSLSQQTIVPDSGKVLSGVTIEPITSTLLTSLDADFKAENIAEGVDMFGVAGTHAGGGGTPGVCTITISNRASTADMVQLDYAYYINIDTGLPALDDEYLRDSLTFTTMCGSMAVIQCYTSYELAASGGDLVAAGGYFTYRSYDPSALWMITPPTPGTYNITVWSTD